MHAVAPYLYRRGKSYYFLIKIPKDIRPLFGSRDHIVKSLKTKVSSNARLALEPIRSKVKSGFLLIRSGLLTDDQLQKILADLTKANNKQSPPQIKQQSKNCCPT